MTTDELNEIPGGYAGPPSAPKRSTTSSRRWVGILRSIVEVVANGDVWLAFVASRLLYFFVVVMTVAVQQAIVYPGTDVQWWGWRRCADIVRSALLAADGGWYLDIVRSGYLRAPFESVTQANWGLFPLYPLAVRALEGGEWTGIALSHAAAGVGLAVLYRITLRLSDRTAATRAVALAAFFPASFAFSSFRPEGLLLAFTAGAFLAVLHERFWVAGALGFFAALCRPPGLLIAIPIAWEALRRARWRPTPALLAAGLPAVGLATFTFHLWRLSGHPLAWAGVMRKGWGASFVPPPWVVVDELFVRPRLVSHFGWDLCFLNAPLTIMALGAVAFLLARGHVALMLYTLASLLLPLSAGTTSGLARYINVTFGVFVAWAGIGPTTRRHSIAIAACAVLLGACAAWSTFGSVSVY